MEGILALLIPIISVIGFHAAVIYWVHMYYTSRNRERMALLESGQDARIFAKRPRPERVLKFGILLFSVGAGILCGYFLSELGMEEEPAYFSMIFLFGGAGLITYYLFFLKRLAERELPESV
ncbi:MAG: DUF6249 domain-containing protein [Saprospiraceae bacterium]|nr:hypothetical protein [Lewinella sp.]